MTGSRSKLPWTILDKLAVVVFVLSLMMFSFAYGVIAHRFKVFPYAVMWEAMVAAKAGRSSSRWIFEHIQYFAL